MEPKSLDARNDVSQKMIKQLTKLANYLDSSGLHSEANRIDYMIRKTAEVDEEEEELFESVEELLNERDLPGESGDISIEFYKGFEGKHLNPDSSFSYFDGSAEELKKLIADNLSNAIESAKKEGTLEVPLPPDKFYSGVVTLEEGDVLSGSFQPHMGHRELRKSVTVARDSKKPAKFAKAIVSLYRESATVYTILASDVENEPMNPQAMMYNRFAGGELTRSAEEFVNALEASFNYWKDKAMWRGI